MASGSRTPPPASAMSEFWFVEDVAPGLKIQTILNDMLLRTESKFQKIEVLDTYFGKTLITDGKSQSSAFDEFAYHESLVHPAMVFATKNANGVPPKTVLIGGGGELATAREVLRWKSVERCVMVDLDGELVEICRKYLPEWGGEKVCADERFELVIGDAYKWIMETEETFDVVIMDISDPIEIGPGIMLYVKEFYEHVVTRMNQPHGVFVTQAGVADAIPAAHFVAGNKDTACYGPIRNTLKSVFDTVVPYTSNIPSFGGDWGFVCAFNGDADKSSKEKELEATNMAADEVDAALEEHVGELRLYDGITHQCLFHLTKPLRKSLEADDRIMTKDNPIFMY